MLANKAIIDVVAGILTSLKSLESVPIILDPVMVATSGDALLEDDAVDALRERLLPMATLITPNLPEAARLLDEPMATDESAIISQGRKLKRRGARAVLMKGGHRPGPLATDLLIGDEIERIESLRVYTKNVHGTGCTLSAAIAAEMAKGATLYDAVVTAKAYVTAAIDAADRLKVGKGRGPLHHFHRQWPDEEA